MTRVPLPALLVNCISKRSIYKRCEHASMHPFPQGPTCEPVRSSAERGPVKDLPMTNMFLTGSHADPRVTGSNFQSNGDRSPAFRSHRFKNNLARPVPNRFTSSEPVHFGSEPVLLVPCCRTGPGGRDHWGRARLMRVHTPRNLACRGFLVPFVDLTN